MAVISNRSFGGTLRVHRMFKHVPDRLMVVPLDHSVSDGPIPGGRDLVGMIGELARNRVDAVVLHKGALRRLDVRPFTDLSLIVHLSASTVHAPDPDAKTLVSTVEDALRLGADAVSVHVNLGSDGERAQIADLGAVADACDRWGMPLLAMMYPRGPRITRAGAPELVAHAAILAADLGADIVKSVYTGTADTMADVVAACPVPLLVAGGPHRGDTTDVVRYVDDVMAAGVAGVAIGRNVFGAPDPGSRARAVADAVHHATPIPAASPSSASGQTRIPAEIAG